MDWSKQSSWTFRYIRAKPSDLPYGVAVNVHDSQSCSTKRETFSNSIVSVKDITLNIEDFVLSFVAKYSLPLYKVTKLIEFAKFLCKYVTALNAVKMDRAASTYKLTV